MDASLWCCLRTIIHIGGGSNPSTNRRQCCCSTTRRRFLLGKRPAGEKILCCLLLLRAVDCVPLARLVIQLLAPNHLSSELSVKRMTNVRLHAQGCLQTQAISQEPLWKSSCGGGCACTYARKDRSLQECAARIRSGRVPEELQRLTVIVVEPSADCLRDLARNGRCAPPVFADRARATCSATELPQRRAAEQRAEQSEWTRADAEQTREMVWAGARSGLGTHARSAARIRIPLPLVVRYTGRIFGSSSLSLSSLSSLSSTASKLLVAVDRAWEATNCAIDARRSPPCAAHRTREGQSAHRPFLEY